MTNLKNRKNLPVPFDLFVVLWNRRQGLTTPQIHLKIASWLSQRWEKGDKYLLLMAFRSSGKSTLVGLFAAWLLYRNPDLRIMVLAAELLLAKKMVRNVKRIIERHPLTAHLKPGRADQWASFQFTVNRHLEQRDPSMVAQGLSGNITGSRADIIICDDVEVPNTSDTAAKREVLREHLIEMNYVLVPGGTILYVGTPHHYYSIYSDKTHPETGEEAPFLEGYQRLMLPVIENGESVWPERFPLKILEKMKIFSGPAKFNSQMLLIPTNIQDGRLNPALLQRYGAELHYHEAQNEMHLMLNGRRMVSASCWWDPAFGAKGKDSSVVAAVFSDGTGNYYLHRILYLSVNALDETDEATQQCRAVADFIDRNYLPSIAIEINGIGKFLPGLLRKELAARKIACSILEKSSTRSKAQRILEAFDAVLAAKALHVHETVWKTPFIREMREWRPDALNNPDDGLDAAAGALLLEPVRFGRYTRSIRRDDWRGFTARQADTEFEI